MYGLFLTNVEATCLPTFNFPKPLLAMGLDLGVADHQGWYYINCSTPVMSAASARLEVALCRDATWRGTATRPPAPSRAVRRSPPRRAAMSRRRRRRSVGGESLRRRRRGFRLEGKERGGEGRRRIVFLLVSQLHLSRRRGGRMRSSRSRVRLLGRPHAGSPSPPSVRTISCVPCFFLSARSVVNLVMIAQKSMET